MVRITDATFSDGVLRPEGDLHLREQERVRIIVQQLSAEPAASRDQVFADLVDAITRAGFSSNGAYPARDELHERR